MSHMAYNMQATDALRLQLHFPLPAAASKKDVVAVLSALPVVFVLCNTQLESVAISLGSLYS